MKNLVLVLVVFFVSNAYSATYRQVEVWTGDNYSSSAPSPYCECDQNENIQDCPVEFVSFSQKSEVCYDEYIPKGSRGWVHAIVYKVSDGEQ